ncbi:hypothetical protein SAMN05444680_12064 [Variovorax sp. YR216]|nr:hypothetical protein SAMN05444680_12064 [Variovorax sp. YR216]
MVPTQIKITGPHGLPFKLGGPMQVFEGRTLLGTLDPVEVLKDGTEVHIEAFIPTQVVLNERRHVGRLIFFEICAYITEHFPQIQAISFAFGRPIDALGRPAEQAASRASAMERIGVVNITVTPLTQGVHVVSGVWPYSEANRVALQTALEKQRAIFREKPIVRPSRAGRVFAKLAALCSQRARG